jgi:quercetin dioxygenase-like cupin family protein
MISAVISHKFTYLGIKYNIYHANKNEGIFGHKHDYSHATICHAGSIAIRKEDKEVIATKDSGAFNLLSNEWHEIEALEDNTVFVNIFAESKY